jgi:polyketide biosynthesis enoyl-CoA hydratase PksH
LDARAVVTRRAAHVRVDFTGEPVTLQSELLRTLLAALTEAAADTSCRALVIASRGSEFCLGMPVASAMATGWGEGSENLCWQLFQQLTTAPVVTLAMVEGPAAGGGLALAAACDLVLAGPGARFRLPEVLLGLVPGMALPVLARRIGSQAATRLALTGREIEPEAAAQIGLVDAYDADPEKLLRVALRGLNGSDREAVALVKSARAQLFPLTDEVGEQACGLLRDRLATESVQVRLTRFRDEGLLS